MIYLDSAATSLWHPKEAEERMIQALRGCGNAGRGAHDATLDAGRIVFETRMRLAELFHAESPERIAFTCNDTEALNTAIFGLFGPGDHVITSSMEHNSVMRPLRFMESRGVELSVVSCSPEGELDPGDIGKAFKKNTKMIVLTHASNVTGTIMPVEAVGALVRAKGDVLFCVDAAQTAGALPIDVEKMSIDLLAFTGHKSLYGPQGTGGLYVRSGLEKRIAPLMMGGTGSRSEFEEQPDFMPDKYESGTPNTIGLAGLGAGVAYVLEQTIEAIRAREEQLTGAFLKQLKEFKDRVTVCGTMDTARRTAVVSFNLKDISPSDAALYFEDKHGILCRPGLHCAPSAHRTIGTFPQGTIRFSFSFFTTRQDIDEAVGAIRDLLNTAAR